MAWSTPPTFVSGNVLTATQLNVLAADLSETIPARATQGLILDQPYIGGTTFAPGTYSASAAHSVSEMHAGQMSIYTPEQTVSTVFTDLDTVGPSVQVTCNNLGIVFMNVGIITDTTATAATGIQIVGATSLSPGNTGPSFSGVADHQITLGCMRSFPVNAGVNLFSLMYAVSSGTTGTFFRRHMTVWPF